MKKLPWGNFCDPNGSQVLQLVVLAFADAAGAFALRACFRNLHVLRAAWPLINMTDLLSQ